jgi:hypothetical protein
MTAAPAPACPLDLVAAEWIRLRSLRSTYLMLLFVAPQLLSGTSQWGAHIANAPAG